MSGQVRAALAIGGLVTAGLVGVSSPAQAGTFKTTTKWKNCETTQSAIAIRATFTNPADYYGTGRYMVKKWVEWEVLKTAGEWREEDRHYTQTGWLQIDNLDYDFISTAADKTRWGNLYASRWRAKVTIKLIKNRPGPRDKKVEEIQIFPTKGSFQELVPECAVEF